MKKGWKRLLAVGLCLFIAATMILHAELPVEAAAVKKALQFLKGNWYSNSMMGDGKPAFYVTFTKNYAKYYEYQEKKDKYKYSYKVKIVSAKKSGDGYRIKLKNKNGKYCYQTADGNQKELWCYSTWKESAFPSCYSASSSLCRK